MAQIIAPATFRSFRAPKPHAANGSRIGSIVAIAAMPLLALVACVGMVDAFAYTQHSLLGLYAVSAPASL